MIQGNAEQTAAKNPEDRLDALSTVGTVTLKVADLDGMIRFYHEGVGLAVIAQEGDSAILGRHGVPALVLEHEPALKHAANGAAGLYHTAILFDSRADLAASVYSVARKYPSQFTGSADHFVSEAFYFDDPEGNGVELYFDRPREAWQWNNGQVNMGTVYLDPNTYLQSNMTQEGLENPVGTDHAASVGHVHLKVGDTATARAFYEGVVGFDVTTTLGDQAIFFSVGGYHHHLAANTWESRGAMGRAPSLGLGEIDLILPNDDAVGALRERLTARGVAQHSDGRTLTFEDPWKNALRVTIQGA
ncbi:VOC family protein [Galactobacter valiniphilus]|uniref:VOC family protein n=1 Tax=Galactobacter valiniphilus TaxID=2676122 RepID=A0A399JDI5_9MICC|nr:VOC family protein [Galactobacter valiniphilus]RII43274.1 VOC family protein [Galactobacter valiniphilus]